MSLTTDLRHAIESGDATIAIRADLEPVVGVKILPPTYAGSVHNMTAPRDDGSSEWCSVDAPASFANRVEAALVPGPEEVLHQRRALGLGSHPRALTLR